ncbi:MAG: M23 family metallopeptidase [SAR86 cluster bacterium]|jgi:murein DD-endopeptidase MepM/ murein hydrolase activator NlpD|nr:M23 family metallopeptidase [SAR86 cluster bacterium]
MYTGSHLRLILTILLVPSVFVFLIAADYENRNLLSEQEITVSEIKIKDNGDDLLLTEENKVIIKRGDTFYSTLVGFGVSPTLINTIAKDKDLKEFIKLRINDEMYISKSKNNLLVKRFDEDFYIDVLTIADGEYDFDKKRDNLERIVQFREFSITESLYASGKKAQVPDSVLGDLIYIFGWDIDYAYDIRNGDEVKILYEDIYSNGRLVSHGDILAAEFTNKGEELFVIRFTQKGRKDYYTTDSSNIRKAFLRTPIEFARISSHYNPNRKHPILNTIKAHKGTDYAARTGTAVKVTGDGVIKEAKFSNSYGNYIDVMHYNKYMTRYAHLNGFAKGIRKGVKVEQGQTIGYVGSTGLATGPHLHYEFHINGKHTDPVKVEPPNAQSINSYNKKYFDKLVEERTDIIKNISSL